MSKTTVVHHSADYDGLFCREIARKFLPDAELIGWDFGNPPLPVPSGRIYVMDLPLDRPFGFRFDDPNQQAPKTVAEMFQFPSAKLGYQTDDPGVIWIDHHKSSIDSHPSDIPGYRIDGVAACRLAWQWFNKGSEGYAMNVPTTKEPYLERRVVEPLAVRLAGEYDIWDKRDERADVFQFGLRSSELSENMWDLLLSDPMPRDGIRECAGDLTVEALLEDGAMLQRYQQRNDAGMMGRSFIVEFEGLKFLALTTARCNSLTFASKDKPETGHDALMGLYFDGKGWTVSLYHAEHHKDIDLSLIAVKHGGGGHRGACGFRATKLPFIP